MAAEEKTEKATPKKRRDQRKEGNVFQSTDVVNVVLVFSSFYMLKLLFPGIYENIRKYMVKFISTAGQITDTSQGTVSKLGMEFMNVAMVCVVPFMLICMVMGILSSGVQTKFLFSSKNAKPKFSRLNPLQGIKKLFAMKNVIELIKNILKVIVLVVIIYTLLKADFVNVVRTMDMDIKMSVVYVLNMIMTMIFRVVMVFAVIAFFDFLYQRWDYEKNIKMTKQEVKEEFKQMEGNPEIKAKVRDIQRQRARSRMMQAVPTADVIIRNPTHYAVALKYDIDENRAPIVVAMGQDELALRIVKVGEENGVAVIENKPLARGLYAQAELEHEIPEEYYGAIAEILVYVYKMNKKDGVKNEKITE